MSMTNLTPSTGRREAVSINLNALRVKPEDRVVYWSPAAKGVAIGTVIDYASADGNWFLIDVGRIFATSIYAKLPASVTDAQAEAIRADFAAFGRQVITGFERISVRDRHEL
jgi:hypothetical protein